MMKSMVFRPLLALLLGLLLPPVLCHADKAEPVLSSNTGGPVNNVPSPFLGSGANPMIISLPTVQVDLSSTTPGVIKTGVVVPLSAPVFASQLSWEPVVGGRTARIRVISTQAKRLRFHVAMPDGLSPLRFRVQGNLNSATVGYDDAPVSREGGIWLGVTDGNTADLEVFADEGVTIDKLDFKIDSVNVITVGAGVPQSIGAAKEKEYDLACLSPLTSYPGLEKAASATALVLFVQDKSSYLCTGTLLADKGATHVPWFATASHCISDQASADTAAFEWFFRASTCGGTLTDLRHWITFGGARLLYTDKYLDPTFLILYKQPPIGAVFSGWDTNIQVGDKVWAVHHPQGDHTMVSLGQVSELLQEWLYLDKVTRLGDVVTFIYGGTEGGSSGSGLFSLSNNSPYWKGTLIGGQVDNYQISHYSHFGRYYRNIRSWLNNTSVDVYPKVFLNTTQITTDYPANVTVEWSTTGAVACSAMAIVADNSVDFLTNTRRGWVGSVPTSAKLDLKVGLSTDFTLSCQGLVGSAINPDDSTKKFTVKVNPPTLNQINCLFDWAEKTYPDLFSPVPGQTVVVADTNTFPYYYTYRTYSNTGAYLGVSLLDNHVHYLGSDKKLQDLDELWKWLETSSCQSI